MKLAKFTIAIGEKVAGNITFQLFDQIVPKTVKNFMYLCSGEKGTNDQGINLHYKGSKFHRIIPNFVIQGGDFTNHNGSGGYSIYGESFDDENFKINHFRYCLSMANRGPNTNSSQFFITLNETPWLDGNHTVFGKVFSGIDLVQKIEGLGTQDGIPKEIVKIVNSSVI